METLYISNIENVYTASKYCYSGQNRTICPLETRSGGSVAGKNPGSLKETNSRTMMRERRDVLGMTLPVRLDAKWKWLKIKQASANDTDA